jgi:CPA2 family monovalent cation:H+ antiporter-2
LAISYFIFGISLNTSLVIASGLAMSSTAIILKMLNENGQISNPFGKKVLGILLFQDIAVIPILLMVTFLTQTDISLFSMLSKTLISATGLILIIFIIGKYLINFLMRLVVKSKSKELFILTVLLITLSTSVLAHTFGFTYSLGAFLGGILIAETQYKHQVEADLVPFRDLLLAVFFVTVGMQIDIGFFIENFFTIIFLAIIIMLIKAVIIYKMLNFFTNKLISLQTALTISQVGEFSFVIFQIAYTYKLLSDDIFALLTLSVIISMIATPFIVKNLDNLIYMIFKRNIISCNKKLNTQNFRDHIIVAGYGEFAKKIIMKLKEENLPYIILVDKYLLYEKAIDDGEFAIFGNIDNHSILFQAKADSAKVLLIALHDLAYIKRIAYSVKDMNKDIKIVTKVTDIEFLDDWDISKEYIIDMHKYGSARIAKNTIDIYKKERK